jgi:hypothetical protein
MDEFDAVWSALQTALKPGIEIKNWNAYNGYVGDKMTINAITRESISIDPPRVWGTQVIPRENFKQVWAYWLDYKALRLKRSEMRGLNEYAKFIISIFRWYETNDKLDV